MKKFYLIRWLLALQVIILFTSCEADSDYLQSDTNLSESNFVVTSNDALLEDFENVSKTGYAGASLNFNDGSWYFDEALIGTFSSDAKNGSNSVRVRNYGALTMEFDLPDGAKSISLEYAKFGRDKSTSFDVKYSTDGGVAWTKLGATINVSKTSLNKAVFNLNVTGNIRFQIVKTDGTSNRFNIDDVLISPNPVQAVPTGVILEDYESASKGSYALGSVVLSSGSWKLDEALLGSLANDQKSGIKSLRIRDFGVAEMEFDVLGAQNVKLNHAVYGTDASSTWELQVSENGGNQWTKVGNTITSNSTALEEVSFPVNFPGDVRFRIIKLSGSGDRINIDNFTIEGTTINDGSGGTPPTGGGTPGVGTVHLTMGNPSNAVANINYPNNYLLEKQEYIMSYSKDKGSANWVSWHLDEAWLGSASRQNDFRADASLPSGWYQVNQTDYSLSGFDRGHMCPSADRTYSVDDNSNTFFMTNMMPQAPNNNRIGWANLENYCRSMLQGGYEIYIISGGYGLGGDGSNGVASYIANGNVQVPSNTWKVIMIIPDGDDDVNRVTTSTRVIAVDMPNSQSISSDWTQYKTSVDDLEMKTGYDFFNLVPDSVEDVIEANVDVVM